jgi:hypothetical protein
VKSVGGKPSNLTANIEANVRQGVAGLESDPYVNKAGTVRVVKPRSRTLHVIFEQGAMNEVTAATRETLRAQSAAAGNRGVGVRWFRYTAAGTKVVISIE